MKVTIVGAGNVGASCAQRIAEGDIADVYLIDVMDGLAAGKALDLAEAAPIVGHSRQITGGQDYSGAQDSAIVVVTAGVTRKPGMSRDELLEINGKIVTDVVSEVIQVAPEAILLMVSNPLDVTTYIAQQISGAPRERVIGMAGVLDAARFATFIAGEVDCSPRDVSAMVLGGHGDSMVPLARHSTVGGIPVTDLIAPDRLNEIIQRTRQGGGEIVSYLKTGSAFYAPSAAVAQMVAAIIRNERRVLPASVQLQGEYGLNDVFVGVPVKLGADGVEEIIELDLTTDELDALHRSAQHVRETIAAWEARDKG